MNVLLELYTHNLTLCQLNFQPYVRCHTLSLFFKDGIDLASCSWQKVLALITAS
jgi:hypothetical protein